MPASSWRPRLRCPREPARCPDGTVARHGAWRRDRHAADCRHACGCRVHAPGPGRRARRVPIRGGVIDIFPAGDDLPARIELVGDTIETIRRYAPRHAAVGGDNRTAARGAAAGDRRTRRRNPCRRRASGRRTRVCETDAPDLGRARRFDDPRHQRRAVRGRLENDQARTTRPKNSSAQSAESYDSRARAQHRGAGATPR